MRSCVFSVFRSESATQANKPLYIFQDFVQSKNYEHDHFLFSPVWRGDKRLAVEEVLDASTFRGLNMAL